MMTKNRPNRHILSWMYDTSALPRLTEGKVRILFLSQKNVTTFLVLVIKIFIRKTVKVS